MIKEPGFSAPKEAAWPVSCEAGGVRTILTRDKFFARRLDGGTVSRMGRLGIAGLLAFFTAAVGWAGPLSRLPNTSLKMPQTPGAFGFQWKDLGLQFTDPSAVVFLPGETNRMFVVELSGRIIVITNLAAPTQTTFLDVSTSTVRAVEEGIFALAFHPQFAQNGRFFIHRCAKDPVANDGRRYNQVSEFRVSDLDPNRADPNEIIHIRQPALTLSHFGGDLNFGADGYLYGSFGDGLDELNNSQQIDRDFYSAVWRIDVDGRPGSLTPNPHPSSLGNYRIPPDNPFVGATQFLGRPVDPSKVRTEFWVVGLRNPFRFHIDPMTTELWISDVGNLDYESLFRSRKGANHGWPAWEGILPGTQPGIVPSDFQTNPAYQYVPPFWGYPHSSGVAIIGGGVYRGLRWPILFGSFLFADHGVGGTAALHWNEDGSTYLRALRYLPRVTDFCVEPITGEVWVSELTENRVWRLEYSSKFEGDPIPESLADTGAFTDLVSLTPEVGIVPYEVNQPFWSDGAHKRRWFSVPDESLKVGFKIHEAWNAPKGTIWIKHFELELTNGIPESSRRMETRFLVRNAAGVYGVTYRWDSAVSARLVAEEGLDEDVVRWVDGKQVTQRWRYPGRAECLNCHTRAGGLALSFNTAQLNRALDYGSERTNQIGALIAAGYMTDVPTSLTRLPALAESSNNSASLEWRARSYLAANCAQCHRPGGSGLGRFDARLETTTELSGLVNGLLNNTLGDPANRVLVPGDPNHSILLHRLSIRGSGQMPPLSSNVADPTGEDLLREWIAALNEPADQESPALILDPLGSGSGLWALQPANRAIHLEMATNLVQPEWKEIDLPETEYFFPANSRAFPLTPPVPTGPEQSYFFRVVATPP